MSGGSSPGSVTRGRGLGESREAMRVSDAERSAVGEELSRHFADGRLDQAEFDERLNLAVKAKTRGDLAGLLVDLPRLEQEPRRARRTLGTLLGGLLALWALVWLAWSPHIGLAIAVVAGVWLWRRAHGPCHHRRAAGSTS